ncbi:hypothetical protein [Ammoniphilus sp. YIM 78166]|uniref:hypothetical protein n=1 Tax=Ammoniphilus sp. YIM 78166 TaxID=1644106 RepID=UPI00106F0D89|nr:hypothetical protein [Ammoniphilus sp. YIM 78166]
MRQQDIDEIITRFGPAKWIEGNMGNIPSEGWFLLEINPLPPKEELPLVVSDIEQDRELEVIQGQVRHYCTCPYTDHPLSPEVQRAVRSVKEQTFTVAVHPGMGEYYSDQPLAIALDPVINYEKYPDHPHLNIGNYVVLNRQRAFIPDSFCYMKDIATLVKDPKDRLIQAFAVISIWLLRHMVWLETRKYLSKGMWIGPEGEPLRPHQFPAILNPNGMCRCGSSKRYRQCHLGQDLSSIYQPGFPVASGMQNEYQRLVHLSNDWHNQRKKPQDYFYSQMKQMRQMQTQ